MDTENHEPIHDQNQPEINISKEEKKLLEITDDIKIYLKGAAKWGKFLAILGFIFIGLLIFLGLFMSIIMSFVPQDYGTMPFPSFLFGLIYIVMAVIYLMPILYLYRFASGVNKALHLNNQKHLAKAFLNLKSHYKFIGILMIIMLVLYFFILIIMLFAGLFTGFGSLMNMQA